MLSGDMLTQARIALGMQRSLDNARQRGIRLRMIPVPVLTPYLSSLWLGLITPVYARVGRKLVDSMRNETLVTNNHAREAFSVQPRDLHQAHDLGIVE